MIFNGLGKNLLVQCLYSMVLLTTKFVFKDKLLLLQHVFRKNPKN